ncbi:hypothetical protein [Bacillus marinisedimentorum]|uniref:hypothetical protein n=1 Tax=Bacillus marinisedimentorum TaxID=1821260 RepID=UPI0007E1B717|nr:hypothetical protein [Bacillus marinisedimentorum]
MKDILAEQIDTMLSVIKGRHQADDETARSILLKALDTMKVRHELVYQADLDYLKWERKYRFSYPAVLEYLNNGEVRITFPDFTDGSTYALTYESATFTAEQFLQLLIERDLDKKGRLPRPESFTTVEDEAAGKIGKGGESKEIIKEETVVISIGEEELDTRSEIEKRWDVAE